MKESPFPFSRFEKTLLIIFTIGVFFSISCVSWAFFKEHSDITTAYGGTYREGVVANPSRFQLNPLYLYGKKDQSVESDIVNLLFSGLMKFNSKTGKVEDYIASHTLSADKKVYTFRIKDGLFWHDGAPLTADDVMFTYKDIISHEDFSNEELKKAFSSVEIKKNNDLEVTFTLQYPYKFFLTNFTVGIVPKHILKDVPVSGMEYADFSTHPIGNGLFKYDSLEEIRPQTFNLSLSAFRVSSLGDPKLDSIEFVLYPSINSLSLDSHTLDGIKPFMTKDRNLYFINDKLKSDVFALPQYSALFFNLKKDIFRGESGHTLRTGLRLGTNKNELLNIVPSVRIDTPLLEIEDEEWEYQYSPEKANGAFKDAGYYFPSKKPKTVTPHKSDEKWITHPTRDPEWIETVNKKVEVAGIFPEKGRSLKLFWNTVGQEKKEIFFHKKVNKRIDNEEWKFEFEAQDEDLNTRGELRVIFYDKNDEEVREDAVSWYWEIEEEEKSEVVENETEIAIEGEEGGEEGGEEITEESVLNNSRTEDGVIKTIETEDETETTISTDSDNNELPETQETEIPEEKLLNNSDDDNKSVENQKKAFDSAEKNATNNIEISLKEINQAGEMRETLEGKPLKLTLLTSSQVSFYNEVAQYLKEDWKNMGVDVEIVSLPLPEFYNAVSDREYDILLYGQNLGYNLDIYEFFHGSQVGNTNLSEYSSEQANVLIQEIRSSHVPEVREKKLEELKFALKRDIPAVFLFSPTYEHYHSSEIQGMEIPYVAFLRDRFSNADAWYIKNDRSFKKNASWNDFPDWFRQKYLSFITFSL